MMTLSIKTLSIKLQQSPQKTLIITTLAISVECHFTEGHTSFVAERRYA
jgi:hypothetical protein